MIIHSPVISGSLTFAEGATFTMPDNGVYSGSFSGSFQGDGSSLTFGGTNIVSSSQQLSLEFLDTLGDGVVSGSSQISFTGITDKPTLVSGSSQISFTGITDKPALVSGSSQVLFNDILNNPFSGSGGSSFISTHLVPSSLTLDLGSPSAPFRDLYLSSASLYINGQQIISSTNDDLSITTDANQSLRIVETGADTITLQTQNGDITLVSTGTGNIELDAPIQIGAGNQIISSDGNAIQFGEDISISGNISVTGTVDGRDIATDGSKLDGIEAGADVTDAANVLAALPAGVVSGSAQVTITESQISDLGSYVATNSVQALNNGTALSLSTNTLTLTKADGTTDTVDLSAYLDEDARAIASGVLNSTTGIVTFTRDDSTTFTLDLSGLLDDTNLVTSVAGKNGVVTLDTDDVTESTNLYYTDARVKTKLNAETVVSGSSQVSFNDISSNPFNNGGSNDITASGHIVPSQTLIYDLGSSDLRWRDLYLSGSTIDLGGTLITRDSSGDINFLDSSTRGLKKVVVEELQIGTGTAARKVKVDNGKIKFFDNTDSEDTGSIQVSSLSIPGLGDLPDTGDDLATRVSALEGTDIQISLSGDVSGTGFITNLGDVSITTTIADDSHNHTIANVDGLQTALNSKAPLASPALTGTPTAPTAATTTNNTQIATTAFVQGRLDEVIGTAGAALDTLGELSASLSDDQDALTALTNTVSGKLAKSSNLSDLTDSDAALTNLGLTATATELNYVDGVTSNIQTQLNSKAASSHTHTASDITDFDTEVSNNTSVAANTAKVGYTDALVKAKLNTDLVVSGSASDVRSFLNVENGATADQSASEIKTAYESNSDTNAFTDAEKSKLSGIAANANNYSLPTATASVLGGVKIGAGITITSGVISADTQSDENFTSALKSKLDGIETGATADQTKSDIDALGIDAATVSGFTVGKSVPSNAVFTDTQLSDAEVQAIVGAMVSSNTESGITVTYQSADGTLDFSVASQTDNNFTTALKSKLDGIEAGAEVNQNAFSNITVGATTVAADSKTDTLTLVGGGATTISANATNDTITISSTNTTYSVGDGGLTEINFTSALKNKLDGIDASADVTTAATVDAAGAVMNTDTSTAAMSFVIDEDTMASNLATKVPTQQSVKTYVDGKVAGLVDSAPGALDTLNELATALGNDSNFSTTVTNSIATKLSKNSNDTASGIITFSNTSAATSKTTGAVRVTGGVGVGGDMYVGGDVVAYASSDERLKKNIEIISKPIDKVMELRGVTWNWKDEASDAQKSTPAIGVIAQDVEKVLPQLVDTRENGYKAVDYGKMVGLLIEAIKDQQKQIDELKSRLQ